MNILRTIKINILALIALLLLLLRILAASAKLIADAMGKAFTVIKVATLFGGIILAFVTVKNSDWTFEKTAALSAIVFINMIDAVYKAVYSKRVQKFYYNCVCDNDYDLLDRKSQAKRILCFAYTLWAALNRAIGWFVRYALRIFSLGSVFVVCGYAINAIVRIYLKYGMNPFQYLNAYGSYDVIGGMIVELAALAGLCVVFISVGIELSDRGEKLFFPYSEKKSYIRSAWENSASMSRNEMPGNENSKRSSSGMMGFHSDVNISLWNAIGYDELTNNVKMGVFESGIKFLVSQNNPNIMIRIVKCPYTDGYGKAKQNVEIALFSKYGEILEQHELAEGTEVFKEFVAKLENEYDIKQCASFTNMSMAMEYRRMCYEKMKRKQNKQYQELLVQHLKTYGEFLQKTQHIAGRSEYYAFKIDYEQYCKDIDEMEKIIKKYDDQVPIGIFEKIIPVIERLDAAKKRIEQQAEQLMKAAQNKQDSGFFKGCDTKEKLEKRYKALCKTYHPDSESGDEDTFKRMSDEYEMGKKNFT